MDAERSIACRAFAKINLDLRVLGVRTDGYHELRTTFQSIALADDLTFTAVPGPFRILCDDPALPDRCAQSRVARGGTGVEGGAAPRARRATSS